MRVWYKYTVFQYSKRATQASEAAELALKWGGFAFLPFLVAVIIFAISGDFSGDFFWMTAYVVGYIVYIILYVTKIKPAIYKMALEDQEKAMREAQNSKNVELPD